MEWAWDEGVATGVLDGIVQSIASLDRLGMATAAG